MICRHYQSGQKPNVAGLNVVTVLVDRSETQRMEVGLCFNTLVIDPPDKSFAESYQQVANGRIARWKAGDTAVGE